MIIIVDGAEKVAVPTEALLVVLLGALPPKLQTQVLMQAIHLSKSGQIPVPMLQITRIAPPGIVPPNGQK